MSNKKYFRKTVSYVTAVPFGLSVISNCAKPVAVGADDFEISLADLNADIGDYTLRNCTIFLLITKLCFMMKIKHRKLQMK